MPDFVTIPCGACGASVDFGDGVYERTCRECCEKVTLPKIYRIKHVGLHARRLDPDQDNPREVALAKAWAKEAAPQQGLNYGWGILQDLMVTHGSPANPFEQQKIAFEIEQRDATIVATIIQWLGSNCGFCFLQQALEDCGYRVTKIRDTKHDD